MGKHIPVSPETYRPRSVLLLQEQLTQTILDYIDRTGLTNLEISVMIRRKYSTFRACYLREMRSGTLLGVSRLLCICEALGIFPVFQIVQTQRLQIAMSEAA
ncbi:hypothetical protein [Allorhizobium undicola]|uniref:hypothetical protein n=1 Tax=Allorhizobium undicola TaxID=78527 RepID=UPI0012B64FB7|nr:hypothetical protein [Allorhizobium undicola]